MQQGKWERQLTAFILIKEGSDISWEQLRLYLQQKCQTTWSPQLHIRC